MDHLQTMKKILIVTTSVVALAFTSCQDMSHNTQRGATTGALIGAGTGAIIGHQSGRTTEGALIGAAAGGIAGGAYGSSRD